MKNIDETIKQQESLAAYFDRRVDRAKDLASAIPRGALYIALEGVDTEEDLVLVERVARIRKVCQPPGLVEITLAADLKHTDYLGVARHTEKVTAEVVMAETEWKLTTTLDVAWTIVVMLKLRRHENILASFCSAVSIDIVPTIADQSIQFNILDDYVARLTVPATPTHVDRDDAEWIENSLMSVLKLRADLDSKRFSLAFSIYHEWNHTTDFRVAMVRIWSALGALFGKRDDREVTETLCGRIASWLPGVNAVDIRTLYDRRCDVVHGRALKAADMRPDVLGSAELLRRALVNAIDAKMRTLDDWH